MNEDHHPVGRPSGERGAMTVDRAELKKRAEEATGGPWIKCGGANSHVFDLRIVVDEPTEPCVAFSAGRDAAYIVAAQPSTVLALLDRIEELEGIALGLCNAMETEAVVLRAAQRSPSVIEALERKAIAARKALSGEKQ